MRSSNYWVQSASNETNGSKHMVPKQQEMDAIIKEIYTALESQQHLGSTLLVLCGDHGMNDAGNHGGASLGETSPALVFISPKFKDTLKHQRRSDHTNDDFHFYRKVDQSDISPTLAGLLGFPIPLNSVGVFIPEFLPLLSNGMCIKRLFRHERIFLTYNRVPEAQTSF